MKPACDTRVAELGWVNGKVLAAWAEDLSALTGKKIEAVTLQNSASHSGVSGFFTVHDAELVKHGEPVASGFEPHFVPLAK